MFSYRILIFLFWAQSRNFAPNQSVEFHFDRGQVFDAVDLLQGHVAALHFLTAIKVDAQGGRIRSDSSEGIAQWVGDGICRRWVKLFCVTFLKDVLA